MTPLWRRHKRVTRSHKSSILCKSSLRLWFVTRTLFLHACYNSNCDNLGFAPNLCTFTRCDCVVTRSQASPKSSILRRASSHLWSVAPILFCMLVIIATVNFRFRLDLVNMYVFWARCDAVTGDSRWATNLAFRVGLPHIYDLWLVHGFAKTKVSPRPCAHLRVVSALWRSRKRVTTNHKSSISRRASSDLRLNTSGES